MTSPHHDLAAEQLAAADSLRDPIATANLAKNYHQAGRLAGRQRAHMKRAEVHALLAIGDELARIGLGQ